MLGITGSNKRYNIKGHSARKLNKMANGANKGIVQGNRYSLFFNEIESSKKRIQRFAE